MWKGESVSRVPHTIQRVDDPVRPTLAASVKQFVAAWIIIVAAFLFYLAFVVPWIEPPALALPDRTARDEVANVLPDDMASHFAEDAWVRHGAKVLLTKNGALIFREHQSDDQGRIVVRPCTLVLFADRQRRERPVIIRAPAGASLRFDGPLRLTGGEPAKFLGGQLEGRVTFERAPSAPNADDGLQAETELVRIGPGRIWTTNAVSFRFGPHYGSGRELLLQLEPATDRTGLRLGKPISLELVQLDQLVFEIPPRKPLTASLAPGKNATTTTATDPPTNRTSESTTMQLKCEGSFLFDFRSVTATLERAVQGYHFAADGTIDRITADRVEIGLVRRSEDVPPAGSGESDKSEEAAGAGQPVASSLGHFRSLKLVGSPAVLDAPSEGIACRGALIDVDHPSGRLRLQDPVEGRIRVGPHEILARDLTYVMSPDRPKQLGRLTVPGPGSYRQYRADGVMEATWRTSATLRPDGNEHLLSLLGSVRIGMGPADFFAGEQIHAWLRQTPKTLDPTRLRAEQKVRFAFRGMSGQTELVEAWFETAPQAPVAAQDLATQPPVASGPASFVDSGAAVDNRPTYDARARVIRLQIERQGATWQVRQGQLSGDVVLRQPPSNRIVGDVIDLIRDTAGWYRVDIVGRPARVTWDGSVIDGSSMHLDQGAERLWMEGAGTMKLPVRLSSTPVGPGAPRAPASGTPMTVQWDRQMEFDGKVARFFDRVTVGGRFATADGKVEHHVTLQGGQMHVTVDPPVDFRSASDAPQSGLSQITFPEQVAIEHVSLEAGRMVSRDRLHVRDLWVDVPSGRFGSQHPGWAESHRFAKPISMTAGAGMVGVH